MKTNKYSLSVQAAATAILCSAAFLVLSACSSTPKSESPASNFKAFQIRKITGSGLQTVGLKPQSSDWPALSFQTSDKNADKFKMNASQLRLAVIGDTGCRLKESKGTYSYQNCLDGQDWIFPQLAQSVAKENYDFLIHTGDYHYREHCTREECANVTKSSGYGWAAWWDDFYGPSQDLFKKSPVLLMRGNHEDCERAHVGWAPLSAHQQQFNSECRDIEDYQWIEMQDLVFINFDNSSLSGSGKIKDKHRKKWLPLLKQVTERIQKEAQGKEVWLLTHVPAFGFVPDQKLAEPIEASDRFAVLAKEAGLLQKVDYILSGHVHSQQVVPRKQLPLQIIVGNSGTVLDAFGRIINNHRVITTTETRSSYGYAVFEREGFKKWKLHFKDKDGEKVLMCEMEQQRVFCE